jgi:hypothetical protein
MKIEVFELVVPLGMVYLEQTAEIQRCNFTT